MSSPAEKSRTKPLREYHSGMYVAASGVRTDRDALPTKSEHLHLTTVKRFPWDEVSVTTPIMFERGAVPTLAALALNFLAEQVDAFGFDRVLSNMSRDAVERLRMAVEADAQHEQAMGELADERQEEAR